MIISHLLELLSKVYFKEFESSLIFGYASFTNDVLLLKNGKVREKSSKLVFLIKSAGRQHGEV